MLHTAIRSYAEADQQQGSGHSKLLPHLAFSLVIDSPLVAGDTS